MAPGASGSPGMVSSSPVKNTATRSLRLTGSCASPTDAARPSSWLRRRAPAGRITLPSRIFAGAAYPFARLGRMLDGDHASQLALLLHDHGIGAGGIMAPVKMRAAVPAAKAAAHGRPGCAAIRQLALPLAQSAARTA
jgi:hypothetical protein